MVPLIAGYACGCGSAEGASPEWYGAQLLCFASGALPKWYVTSVLCVSGPVRFQQIYKNDTTGPLACGLDDPYTELAACRLGPCHHRVRESGLPRGFTVCVLSGRRSV